MPATSYSSFCHPRPTPSSNLPLEIESSVLSVLANTAGFRKGAIIIAVANLMVDVWLAIIVKVVRGSNQLESDGRGKVPKG